MPKTVQIQGTQVKFRPQCSLCLEPASQTYTVERTLTYGKRTILLKVPVPMCIQHHQYAMHTGKAEQWVGQAGLVAGVLVGLLTGGGLLAYWAMSQQGNLVMNLLLAAFIAAGFFLIVWLATAFWLAPLFAEPDARAARHAVRIHAYWPNRDVLHLRFVNDLVADLVARDNGGTIVE
jgi:hypothetical protein